MENTGKVLFKNDAPQWYVAMGDRWEGPLAASEVYQKVLGQEISWAHYVWRPGKPGWQRICDQEDFQAAVPPVPTKTLRQEVKEAATPAVKPMVRPRSKEEESGIWFLYEKDSQFGPFRKSEMVSFIQSGRIKGGVFAWRNGMENWAKIETIADFKESIEGAKNKPQPPSPPAEAVSSSGGSRVATKAAEAARRGSSSRAEQRAEQRITPRRPLVARIMMAKDDELAIAICRDISIGGLQVLTDRIPGPVGTRVKMNVSAVGKRAGRTKIEPFVAEGVIVRILEDGRGFSFRFSRLAVSAKRTIEAYINAAG